MTEVGNRGEQLLMLSVRDLAEMYSRLPFDKEAPWQKIDEETESNLEEIAGWLNEQNSLVVDGSLRPEEVEELLISQMDYLATKSGESARGVERWSFFMRGMIWVADAAYWHDWAVRDALHVEDYLGGKKSSMQMAAKLFMAAEILAGSHDIASEDTDVALWEQVVTLLKNCDYSAEAEDIRERLEVRTIAPGDHGRARPDLN